MATVPFQRRIDVIRELMRTLDIVTLSGQGHVMHRILSILRREIASAAPWPKPQLIVVTRALDDLAHEAGRRSAAPAVFNSHVRPLVDILSNVWKDRAQP